MIQLDFWSQKCEIEEFITISANEKYYIVFYYLKYYCELNYIKDFWYNTKK